VTVQLRQSLFPADRISDVAAFDSASVPGSLQNLEQLAILLRQVVDDRLDDVVFVEIRSVDAGVSFIVGLVNF
jgi:hypothetical protein